MYSLLTRQQREGRLTANSTLRIQRIFLKHVSVMARARGLVARHPLRTLDAIQLACALEVMATLNDPVTFIGADIRLLAVAAAESLATQDANAHP